MKYSVSILFAALMTINTLFGQHDIEKELIGVNMVDFQYAFQIPSGDLSDRFGVNSSIGGGYNYKTKKNWLIGIELNYMFSQNIKNADKLFWDLEVHPGEFIVNAEGNGSSIRLYERGVNGFVKFGKLFSVLSPNPNSGFFVTAGLGYMGYKIKIHSENNEALIFQNKDYMKLYDRYTGGFALSESIGYMYLSNNRILNFYVAANFVQGFTKNLRKYNADEMKYTDQSTRNDLLFGFRIGWIFNIYQRAPQDYYYN
ncbi:MAG: hypothetical protein LBH92_07340 [Bacteroidales bacterium]|jgi:hypothetical protein|nr:hypothetical protein [Bacteroidales bacterium]